MTILCYHTVQSDWRSPLAIRPEDFAEHCAWLAANRRVLTLGDAVAGLDARGRGPANTTALTFDDGFAAVYEHAWPVLGRHGLPATVFLVAETLTPQGRPVDWVDDPPPFPLRTLDADQVLEMQEAGVRFESHSYAHHDLTTLSEAECLTDLSDAREVLEDLLGRPVRYLAYPRGRHAPHVHRAAARAGYTHAFTLPESPEAAGALTIPRAGVYPGNGTAALRLKTTRWYVRVRTSRVFPLLRMAVRGRRPARRPPG